MPTKPATDVAIVIDAVRTASITVHVIGTSPLVANSMSEKARHELLAPAGRKNAAAKAASLKHDPLEEFRASPYRLGSGPTLIGIKSTAFKGAMGTAALDLPNATRSRIGRLVYVEGDMVPIYGIPEVSMAIVRSADMNRTPDVRTRAILPRWAAKIDIRFVVPMINEQSVVNLLGAGGITAGVGDWRPEKGKGNFGQYRLTNADDPEYLRIVAEGGREAQVYAMENPGFYDTETETLWSWFGEEMKRRGSIRSVA